MTSAESHPARLGGFDRRSVSVVEECGRLSVELDGLPVKARLTNIDEAIELAALLVRCSIGDDADACEDLDRRGVEGPVIPPDDVVVLDAELAQR